MARSQERSKRKLTGGRYHSTRSKRKFELARRPAATRLSETTKRKSIRTLGGNAKTFLLSAQEINVANKGKVQKTTMKNVVENKANPHLVRRNILTKGAVVETELGKARITNRPGQEGSVNAVLLE